MKNFDETVYMKPRDLSLDFVYDNTDKSEPPKISLESNGVRITNCVMINCNADGRRSRSNCAEFSFVFEYRGSFQAKGITVLPFDSDWKNKIFCAIVWFVNKFVYADIIHMKLKGF